MTHIGSLHEQLHRWRVTKGYQMARIAEICLVSVERVKAWESGSRTPRLDEREALKSLGFNPHGGWNFVRTHGRRESRRWDEDSPAVGNRFLTPEYR